MDPIRPSPAPTVTAPTPAWIDGTAATTGIGVARRWDGVNPAAMRHPLAVGPAPTAGLVLDRRSTAAPCWRRTTSTRCGSASRYRVRPVRRGGRLGGRAGP